MVPKEKVFRFEVDSALTFIAIPVLYLSVFPITQQSHNCKLLEMMSYNNPASSICAAADFTVP
jgi:hypothetical protein